MGLALSELILHTNSGKFSRGSIVADRRSLPFSLINAHDHAHYTMYNHAYFVDSSLHVSANWIPKKIQYYSEVS
jgi:hypothetical protein